MYIIQHDAYTNRILISLLQINRDNTMVIHDNINTTRVHFNGNIAHNIHCHRASRNSITDV